MGLLVLASDVRQDFGNWQVRQPTDLLFEVGRVFQVCQQAGSACGQLSAVVVMVSPPVSAIRLVLMRCGFICRPLGALSVQVVLIALVH